MSELTDSIRQGDLVKVAKVLDEDASLLQSAENGVTPILLALYHGRAEVAHFLVERGAALTFGEACALGDLDRVRTMLSADRAVLEKRTADGFPPLGLSIFFKHPEVARYLIEQGADVNAAADNAMRVAPLHAAASACDRDTMRLILDRGGDPNALQQMGYTALHGAAARGDREMAEMLLAHGAERTPRGTDGQTPADVARSHGQAEFEDWIEKAE